ncbi:BMC domain-containing protein [Salipaludibacillus daqingensis]|uniref:BMC domain-containing protein n=1 Tax=Salipaludibacillus daqingensis TaxID=3041001 RepID=UPI0024737444|nr:BMC domain-containing protein [Salipaludibacillus daqingensis]
MYQSYGFVEVIGYIAASACADAMVKAAYVKVDRVERIGAGYVTVAIKGDLASVQAALQVAEEVAHRFGELVVTKVIARPYEGCLTVMESREEGDET